MRSPRIARSLALLCCVIVALTGCSGGKKKAKTTSTTTVAAAPTVASSAPASSTSTTVPCPAGPLNAAASTGAAPSTNANVLLTSVSARGAKCLDNVAFGFKNGVPGYTVNYGTPPFVQDGSGNPVAVAGNAFIVVKMKPAYGYDFENGAPSYTGSKRIAPPGAAFVTEVVETGDFEGSVTWVIGLNAKRPFKVAATHTTTGLVTITIS